MFVLVILTSCSVGPNYEAPSIEVPIQWKNDQINNCTPPEPSEENLSYYDHWWEVFEDSKLDELELLAVENNKDLFVAFERIIEAKSLMGIAEADFYPQLTVNPLFTNTSQLIKTFGNNNFSTPEVFRVHQLLYYLPLNLSYEVDLWGRIRDRYNAAEYNWFAVQKDFEAVMLSLTTDLATAYFQLRSADSQLNLLKFVLNTRLKSLQINQDRYDEQVINYADVTLAAEEVESAKLQYAEVERQRAVLENQIALFTGSVASDFKIEHIPLAGLPPCIPQGLPSEILLRRPDIQEAEYQAQSTHASVKEAYSLFFPSLTLTAATGFESPVLKHFLRSVSRYWMNGTQVDQIFFDGGRTASNVELQVSRFQQASGTYQQQVLRAFQEVENSLVDLDSYAKQYDIAVVTTKWAEKTFQLYSDRYLLGVVNYLNVANTQRDLLAYQILVNNMQGYRFVSTVQLIKALGGGW